MLRKSKLIKIVLVVSSLIVAFVAFGSLTHKWYVICGPSMSPTINAGMFPSLAFVGDNTNLQEGDVIVFNHNNCTYVKRVALLGHGIYVYGPGGYCFYAHMPKHPNSPVYDFVKLYNIKSDEVVVYGDNVEASLDSRQYGPIKISEIYGKVSSTLSVDNGYLEDLHNINHFYLAIK